LLIEEAGKEAPRLRSYFSSTSTSRCGISSPRRRRTELMAYMHKKIDKDCACGSGDKLADRQTFRRRQTDIRAHYSTSSPLPRA